MTRWSWGCSTVLNNPGNKVKKDICIGPPRLTRFEKTRIVGARSLQLTMGAPILIKVRKGKLSPIDIALEELEANLLPMTIRRTLPDGSYQDIPLKWLLEEKS
ncbi:MAG: DNA-directed RNA polymerase subunit K [Candidatus Bathyarchaeia archaeon]